MKVGDLVREVGLQERTGVIMQVIQRSSHAQVIYKVLGTVTVQHCLLCTIPAWTDQLEVINESR